MKYSTNIYAKALAEVVEGANVASDEAVKHFLSLLRKNGEEAHLRKIVEEAERFVHRKTGVRKVTLESARPLDASQKESLKHFIQKGDVVAERTNSKLIAGVKIVVNGERQFDGSMKNKLDALFGN